MSGRRCRFSDLLEALVAWFRSPEIRFSPSDEVLALRSQVQELQAQVVKLEADATRAQTLYAQECVINLTLEDELRALGVRRRR